MVRRTAATEPTEPSQSWPSDPTVPTEWVSAKFRAWVPRSPGAEPVGRFLGLGEAADPHGSFVVARLRGLDNAVWVIGGVAVLSSLEDAGVLKDEWIRLVYQGTEDRGDGRTMKRFELFLGKPP